MSVPMRESYKNERTPHSLLFLLPPNLLEKFRLCVHSICVLVPCLDETVRIDLFFTNIPSYFDPPPSLCPVHPAYRLVLKTLLAANTRYSFQLEVAKARGRGRRGSCRGMEWCRLFVSVFLLLLVVVLILFLLLLSFLLLLLVLLEPVLFSL